MVEESVEVVGCVDVVPGWEEVDGAVVCGEDVEGGGEDVGGAPGDVGEHLGEEGVWCAGEEVVAAVVGGSEDDVVVVEFGEGLGDEGGGEVGDVGADEDGFGGAGGEGVGDGVVHACAEVWAGLGMVGVVWSKPVLVVRFGVGGVVADGEGDVEGVEGGEGVGDEVSVEGGCVVGGEGGGESLFDGAWLWVFGEEEDVAVVGYLFSLRVGRASA